MSVNQDLFQRLSRLLDARNSFAIVDNLNKPTHHEYVSEKIRIRRNVRQTIKDIRHWRKFMEANT